MASTTHPYFKEFVIVDQTTYRLIISDADMEYADDGHQQLIIVDPSLDAGKSISPGGNQWSTLTRYYDSDDDYWYIIPYRYGFRRKIRDNGNPDFWLDQDAAYNAGNWSISGPTSPTVLNFKYMRDAVSWSDAGFDETNPYNTSGIGPYTTGEHGITFYLDEPLQNGGTYTFTNDELGDLSPITVTYSDKLTRFVGIKTNQEGWRPDDFSKLAVLGHFDRSHGPADYSDITEFGLINELGSDIISFRAPSYPLALGTWAQTEKVARTWEDPLVISSITPGAAGTNRINFTTAHGLTDTDYLFFVGIDDINGTESPRGSNSYYNCQFTQGDGGFIVVGQKVHSVIDTDTISIDWKDHYNGTSISLPSTFLTATTWKQQGLAYRTATLDAYNHDTYRLDISDINDLPNNVYAFYVPGYGRSDWFKIDPSVYEQQRIVHQAGYLQNHYGVDITADKVGYDRPGTPWGTANADHPWTRSSQLAESSGEITSNLFPATDPAYTSLSHYQMGTIMSTAVITDGSHYKSVVDAGDHDAGLTDHCTGNIRMQLDYLTLMERHGLNNLEALTPFWPRLSEHYDSSFDEYEDAPDLAVHTTAFVENFRYTQVTDSGSPGYGCVVGGFTPYTWQGGIGGAGGYLRPDCQTEAMSDGYLKGTHYAAGVASLLNYVATAALASHIAKDYSETKRALYLSSAKLCFDLCLGIYADDAGQSDEYYEDYLKVYSVGLPDDTWAGTYNFTVAANGDVNTSTNQIALTRGGSAPTTGTKIRFTTWDAAALPGGITRWQDYYLRVISSAGGKDTCSFHPTSLDATNNTNAVDITSQASGAYAYSTAADSVVDDMIADVRAMCDSHSILELAYGCLALATDGVSGEETLHTECMEFIEANVTSLGPKFAREALLAYNMCSDADHTFADGLFASIMSGLNNAGANALADKPYPNLYGTGRWNWVFFDPWWVASGLGLGDEITHNSTYTQLTVVNDYFKGRNHFGLCALPGLGHREMRGTLHQDAISHGARGRGLPQYVNSGNDYLGSFFPANGPWVAHYNYMTIVATDNIQTTPNTIDRPKWTWYPPSQGGQPGAFRWFPSAGAVYYTEWQIGTNVQPSLGPLTALQLRGDNTIITPQPKKWRLRGNVAA